MKKLIITTLALATTWVATAQEHMAPAAKQGKPILIYGATIHVGNGTIIENGQVKIENGKITLVGTGNLADDAGTEMINATGKHVYPGLIATSTNLGLVEVSSTKSTQDSRELGDINPSIQSIVAYNSDSKIINTLRSNGILLAHIVPQGGTVSGQSSVVQLDAWNWEDAVYSKNNGMHINMPALIARPSFGGGGRNRGAEPTDAIKQGLQKIDELEKFWEGAKAYYEGKKEQTNLKYEALKSLFMGTQKLYVHCDLVREMLIAINWKTKYNFDVVIVGGTDSYLIADQLALAKVPVILSEPHSLPAMADDAVDQPYKTGAMLQKAGVVFTFCQDAGDGFWQQRCIPFQAGTMAAYGLTKEEALQSITLNAAKALGIESVTGSIAMGKDANIVISEGDILDMITSKVTHAFIQGRKIDLNNKHTELYKKYKKKYLIEDTK